MANKSKAERLVEFYRGLLEIFDVVSAEDGLLTYIDGVPIMLNEMRMALPTKENLRLAGNDEVVIFHPLSESVFEGMSDVLAEFRYMVSAKAHKVITFTAYTILKLVVDKAGHANLSDKQAAVISQIAEADEKTVADFKKLMNKLEVTGPQQLLNIFLKYGGQIKDKKYMRTAHVSFPLIEELHDCKDSTVYGVKLRKKDIATFIKLFDIVLPKAETPEAYSAGSSAPVAPYFMALVRAFINIMETTAPLTWKFRSAVEEEAGGRSQHISADKMSEVFTNIDEISELVNAIPAMKYNTGNGVSEKNEVKPKHDEQDDDDDISPKPRRKPAPRTETRDEPVSIVDEVVADIVNANEDVGQERRSTSRRSARDDYDRRDDRRSRDSRESGTSSRGGWRSAPRQNAGVSSISRDEARRTRSRTRYEDEREVERGRDYRTNTRFNRPIRNRRDNDEYRESRRPESATSRLPRV